LKGEDIFAPPHLHYFLHNDVDASFFNQHPEALRNYEYLDDNDIWSSVKVWAQHKDKLLSLLAKDLLERNIFKVEIREEPVMDEELKELQLQLAAKLGINEEDAHYLANAETIQKDMYNVNDDHISILFKDGTIKDITEASEILNVALLSKKIRKYYLCYQRI
jgi:hypothetical protein